MHKGRMSIYTVNLRLDKFLNTDDLGNTLSQ